jgi:flagellar assembly factor FliW
VSDVVHNTASEGAPLHFETGLPGFADAHRFVLDEVGGGAFELRCLDKEGCDFVVVPPAPYFPDYAPMLDDAYVERLDLRGADEALLLLVVTLGSRPEDATANLLAPIVINQRTRCAAQVVLAPQPYPLRAPLLEAA